MLLRVFPVALLASLAFALWGSATEPTIRNLNLRGLQIGGATTLVVDGDDLGTAPKLLLPFPVQQELKAGATDKQATFTVQLAAEAPAGFYQLRVATDGGTSLPMLIGVDKLPQQPFAPAVLMEQFPVALHGAVGGSAVLEAKLAGKAGQKLLVEVESQRLGSKLRPVLHLYGPDRRQMAWSWPTQSRWDDTLLEATLPADGQYTLALHDTEYGPPGPGFFRLKIGEWSTVEQIFPPVVAKGQPLGLELLGRGAPARLDLPATTQAGALPIALPDGVWSGAKPFVTVSGWNEILERAPAEAPQELPTLPVGVSGRLAAPFEEDRYKLAVTPGMKLKLEVFAERLGSPLDAALLVRNDKDAVLARADDGPGMVDPVLEFVVPDQVTALVLGVADPQGRGSPRGIYRLAVEVVSPGPPPSDYSLTTPIQRIALPANGRFVFPVYAERRGAAGPIELLAGALPAGVRLSGTTIRPEVDGALVLLERDATPSEPVLTSFRGKSAAGDERPLTIKGHPLLRQQPWLASEIALAPSAANSAEFTLDWKDLPADASLLPAGKLSLPFTVARPEGMTLVRLSLLTSQSPPLVNNQPDLNRTLRAEKPVELAANVKEGELTILIPPDPASPDYDVTLQAELLPADRRTVLATAFAPLRRMAVKHQIGVQLTTPPRMEASVDPKTGAMLKLEGKVERRDGWTGDVVLAITGLPPGVQAGAVTVKADASDFVINLVLPANLAAGEFHGMKLSGTGVAEMKQPNVRVKSRDVDLILVAQRAAPPPP